MTLESLSTAILALDLAWGTTGWAYRRETDDAVAFFYGKFSVNGEGWMDKAIGIGQNVRKICEEFLPNIDILAYEYTDWHRRLKGNKWAIDYAIERKAQRTLGRAEASLLLGIAEYRDRLQIVPVGANKAKKEFGASSMLRAMNLENEKEACAAILCERYPQQFSFGSHLKSAYMRDVIDSIDIGHDISDAIMLTEVVAGWHRFGTIEDNIPQAA